MAYRRVKALQDDEGHWYKIPNRMEDKFNQDLEVLEPEEFAELYEDFRTHDDLNNVQLYVKD